MIVKLSLLAALYVLILSPVPAFAWGAEGHEIAAAIAARELTPAAQAQVSQLLGGEGMLVHDANWADEIRNDRQETEHWHFADIPLAALSYDATRDCRQDDCIVAQIERDRRILADRQLPAVQRAEALRFLIHFLGDIHQPLHAVDNNDRGGNVIRVYFPGGHTNLHHVWDTNIVEVMGPDAEKIAIAIDRSISPGQKKLWQAGTPESWANESHALARVDIYGEIGDRKVLHLTPDYLHGKAQIAVMQLAKAGMRLAWVLNTALN